MGKLIDITGQTFSRLTVVQCVGISRRKKRWLCRCVCGTEKTLTTSELRGGHTRSCGCLRDELIGSVTRKHGQSHIPLYSAWRAMVDRCTNPASEAFKNYGARGITVCERWLMFENFLVDMGTRPAGKSLDRRDNDKGYSPENCYWATREEQANNTRVNRRVIYCGKEMSLTQACKAANVSYDRTHARIWLLGWSFEDAIGRPKVEPRPPAKAKQLHAA